MLAATFVATCLMTTAAVAADPTGSYKWTAEGRNGPQEITVKLVFKDGQLTGTVTQPGRRGGAPTVIDISNASFKDDVVTFSVVVEYNTNKTVTTYKGKLSGDTITGAAVESGRGGDAPPTMLDWTATRMADSKT